MRARCDMYKPSQLQHTNLVPLALASNAGLAWPQVKRFIGMSLSGDSQPATYDVKNFIAIRMHLSIMRWVIFHAENARC